METSANILIVEDQPAERESLARLLRTENYQVHSVANATSALDSIGQPFDLVLSDVRLGGSSGLDLLKMWKSRLPATPFILMTAFGEIESAVEAVKAGADDYLVKPIRPTELLAKIARSLDAARKRAAGPASSNGHHNGEQESANGLHFAANVPLDEIERAAIERTLEDCKGNRTHAAQALGISVRTLQRKLKAWNAEAEAAHS
jgi:DNA-binding NtrC family response regulator